MQVQATSSIPPATATMRPGRRLVHGERQPERRRAQRRRDVEQPGRGARGFEQQPDSQHAGAFQRQQQLRHVRDRHQHRLFRRQRAAATGFIPGARTSPTNGVTITACYAQVDFANCSDAGVFQLTTTLTVAAEPLSITIGTDRKIVVGDLTYQQRFVVTASDIAGRPRPTSTSRLDRSAVLLQGPVRVQRRRVGQLVHGRNHLRDDSPAADRLRERGHRAHRLLPAGQGHQRERQDG